MELQLLKSKIHRARITFCHLEYEGSLSLDRDLMDAVGIVPYERLLIVNATNGERLETYAIPAERGSGAVGLNGAAARRGQVGDVVTIMAFVSVPGESARKMSPQRVLLDERNAIVKVEHTATGE